MKKILVFLIASVFVLTACSKGGEGDPIDLDDLGKDTGLIEFKLNGKAQKHTFLVSAGEKPHNGINDITAAGGKGEKNKNGDRPSIDFFLVELSGAKVGKVYTSVNSELVGQYYQPAAKGEFINFSSDNSDINDNRGYFELVFTEISDRGMKGRFHGTMYDHDHNKLVVEDARFDLLYTDFIFD